MELQQLTMPLAGGALIGLAAALLLVFNGRIAGISGIFSGLLTPHPGDTAWRGAFVGGLVLGGALLALFHPAAFPEAAPRSLPVLGMAGLLVGFGVRLGSGCTSGHGVCGIGRRSPRSVVATLTFITSGALAVWLMGGVR